MRILYPSLLLLSLLLPCGGALVCAQNKCHITLSGTVKDETGEGLLDATITLLPIKKSVVSDLTGNFQLDAICPGEYDIEVRFLGYKTIRQKKYIGQSLTQNFLMEIDETLMNEVTVEDVQPAETTNSYALLSKKELENAQNKSLGKLLADGIAGVTTIQTGPTIFKPVIHGVHSQRILILNDGLKLAGQGWGAEHAPAIDPFAASHITVVKDAGVIKYGSGALGGVIIITPEALPEKGGLGGQFSLSGSTNGLSGVASGMLEGGFDKIKGLGWRAQGKIKRSGDFNTPEYILSNTGFEEYTYEASVGFHRNKLGIEATYSSFNNNIGILRGSVVGNINNLENALENEPPLFTSDFTYDINNPRQQVTHNLFKINGHYKGKHAEYRLQYGLQHNERMEFDIRRGGLNNTPAIHLNLTTHALDVEVEYSKKKVHSRSIGANGVVQSNSNVAGTQRIPFIPNYTHYSVGLYDIEHIRLEKILLEAGIRYDYKWYDVAGRDFENELFESNLNFHSVSGTLGINYFINPYITLISNVGTAWRPLTMAELYSAGTHQSAAAIEYGLLLDEETTKVVDANTANIKNEQAIKWVNTIDYTKDKLSFEVSIYINYILNYTYLRPRGVTSTLRGVYPYFRYIQTNASFIGADFSGEYAITPLLKLNGKIAWLHATDEGTNDKLIAIPSNRFELGLHYEKPISSNGKLLSTEIKAKYIMRQYRAPQVISVKEINAAAAQGIDIIENRVANFDFLASPEGYFLAEINAGITLPIKENQLDIRLSVENLLNTKYREYTNRMRYYANEIGRNFTITLKYQF